MNYCIAVTNVKGGVGKTTTAVNLAASFAAAEKRVLIVDLVQEGGVHVYMGSNSIKPGISELGKLPIKKLIHPSQLPNLFYIPSDLADTATEEEFTTRLSHDHLLLKKEIAALKNQYEIIILDCPASMGATVLAGLLTADLALVPMQCEPNSQIAVKATLRTIEQARSLYGSKARLLGILLTMFDRRTALSHNVLEQIWDEYQSDLLETIIPRNVRLAESFAKGTPAVLVDINSTGALAYLALASEIMARAPKILAQN